MTENSRQKLIVDIRAHINLSVERIQENYNESSGLYSYHIQLNQNVEKGKVVNEILKLVEGRIDFEDSFDLWVNSYGEDFDTQATKIPVNESFTNRNEPESDEVLTFRTFRIEANGETLTVHPQHDGTFVIWKHTEKLGYVFPESAGEVIVWSSGETISKDWTDTIGKAIEKSSIVSR